jgi:hypothetical protein
VVYLDPMFPHKQKSALVKKEMRVSVAGGAGSGRRWPAGTGASAGDQTGGGEASGLRAAAGGCRYAERGGTKGHRFDIYENMLKKFNFA